MTNIAGIIVILIGAANLGSADGSGLFILLAGLCIVGYGMGGKVGFGIALLVAQGVVLSTVFGWPGASIGACVLIAALVCAIKRNTRTLRDAGFTLRQHGVIKERRQPGPFLSSRLEALHASSTPRRGENQSRSEFRQQQSDRAFFGAHDEFDIESGRGEIVTAAGPRFAAELHSIVLYRKPGRYRKTLQKQVVERKIDKVYGIVEAVPAHGSVTCLNQGDFPVSLKRLATYHVMEGSVRIGELTLLRILDESREAYLFPQSLFSPVSIHRTDAPGGAAGAEGAGALASQAVLRGACRHP